jgi:hypothetical protein
LHTCRCVFQIQISHMRENCLSQSGLFHLTWWLPVLPIFMQTNIISFSFWLNNTIVYIYHTFFTHSSIIGHQDWFYSMEQCCSKHGVQVFLWCADLYSFICTSRSGITGSYGNSNFSFFLKKKSPYFYCACTHLHSSQQCISAPFCPTSH